MTSNGDNISYFVQLPDGQFLSQEFYSLADARLFCAQHRIHGYQILDEYQLAELKQQYQQRPPHRTQSIIRKHFVGSNPRGYIPTARPSVAPNRPAPYHPVRNSRFQPHFIGRRKKKQ